MLNNLHVDTCKIEETDNNKEFFCDMVDVDVFRTVSNIYHGAFFEKIMNRF